MDGVVRAPGAEELEIGKDTIIVGAGSAGCVLARRLTERSDRRVILLEAGPDYPPDATLPHDLARGGRNSFDAHDWGYRHKPNSKQVTFRLPRGKVVGGSSAVNTCIAIRGQPEDYAEWELEGWDWADCLRAFKRLERDLDFPDSEWHGDDGPIPIRRHPDEEWTPWQAAFVEGCRELGHPACEDGNRPGTVGVGPHAMNKIDGRRVSAAEGYLTADVRSRDNLEIRAETLVERIVFEGDRAVGVEVTSGGESSVVRADEIVVCAGAIDTPHLLMRSGVGPRKTLEAWGVEVVRDSPSIGARLLDHPGIAIFLRPRFFRGTSPRHDLIQTSCRYASGTTSMPNDLIMQAGSAVPLPWVTLPFVSIMVMVGKPHGVGRITWSGPTPDARPTIESGLLDHPEDRRVAVEAIEHCFEVANTPAAREVARPLYPAARTLRDRDRLDDKIRAICDSGYHPCGTVPMGDDAASACDERGRVRGVEALRVVDASLMPTIPHANIHLSVLMMAERIAEWM